MCDELIEKYNKGELELQPGHDAALTLEAKITKVLNDIRDIAAKVLPVFTLLQHCLHISDLKAPVNN